MRKLLHNTWFWFLIFCVILGFVFYGFLVLTGNWVNSLVEASPDDYTTSSIKAEPNPTVQNKQTYTEQVAKPVQQTSKPQVTKQVQSTATKPQVEQAKVLSDNCQYPDRYYPDGSCDNSDPACPETIKDPILKGRCE